MENLDGLSLMWVTLKWEVGTREPGRSVGSGCGQRWFGLRIFESSSQYFFGLTVEGKEKWACILLDPSNFPPAFYLSQLRAANGLGLLEDPEAKKPPKPGSG